MSAPRALLMACLSVASLPSRAGELAGCVRTASGKPAPGAIVALADGKHPAIRQQTGAGGCFRFVRLAAGAYGISATTPDAGAAFQAGVAVPAPRAAVDLTLAPGGPRLLGRVTAPGGKLPAGVVVTASRISDATGDAFHARPARGTFRLSALPGTYLLAARAPGWYGQSMPLQLADGLSAADIQLYREKGSNPALATALTAMERRDQQARQKLIDTRMSEGAQQEVMAVDQHNARALARIVHQLGWPRARLVGYAAEQAAWTLIQHEAGPLRKSLLPQLKAAAEAGEIPLGSYALAIDKDLVGDAREQLYGSQFRQNAQGVWEPYPIADAANVDRRRAAMGLGPLAEYAAMIARMYRQAQPEHSPP